MTYGRHLAVVGAALVLAAGCGREDAEPPTPADPTSTTAPSETATPPPVGGQDASADLSQFVCAPDPTGAWNATGVLTPSGPARSDYSVTVVVADAEQPSAQGRRRVLADPQPGTPVAFEILDIPPAGSGDLTCQVEVLRLDA